MERVDDAAETPIGALARLGGRYELRRVLAHGSHGEVWRAHDYVTDGCVAVKLLSPANALLAAQMRREIASLRTVQVPGVVRLLDEGHEGAHGYLVMELVPGLPFPGRRSPVGWCELAEVARELLVILGRVHAAGVVHQDVKPANVLVYEGRPTLLDFGVAWGGLYDELTGGVRAGTPAYMAPEQVDRGPISSATDLYAVGTMLFEALSGRLPFERNGAYETMFARCFSDPPSLGDLAVDVPRTVVEAVDAMIRRDPEQRPRDAHEALELLAGRPSQAPPRGGDDGPPWSVDELRSMIVGPDAIFHVPEDTAAVLWERTGGDRARVRSELDAWVRVGFARRDGARVVLDRAAVDRLLGPAARVSPAEEGPAPRPTPWPRASTAETLRAGAPCRPDPRAATSPPAPHGCQADVVREGVAAAQRSLADGHTGRGLAALADAWLTVNRVAGPVADVALRETFALWTELALVDGTPAAIDRALHELARARGVAAVADLEALLQAALVMHQSPARAFEESSALPEFAEPALERWRRMVRTQSSRLGSLERGHPCGDAPGPGSASDDPRERAASASQEAWSLYHDGRFAESAERHLASADLDVCPASRLSSVLAAAAALLEGFEPERALSLATAARATAASLRLCHLEARARWVERAALYRLDRTSAPDLALVDSARAVGVGGLHAMVAMTEAAVAWRAGEIGAARELSMAAFREWRAAGRRWAPDMARSLAVACGGEVSEGEADTLAREALACPVPMAGLQVLALMAAGRHPARSVTGADVARLAALVPRDSWTKRAAVLSTDEALVHLRGAG